MSSDKAKMASCLSNSERKITKGHNEWCEHSTGNEQVSFTTNALESYLYGKKTVLAVGSDQTAYKGHIKIEKDFEKVSNSELNNNTTSGLLKLDYVKQKNENSPLQSLRQLVHTKARHKPSDVMPSTYAMTSFPAEVRLCTSSIPGADYGVCAKKDLPAGTWIGPYEGRRTTDQQQINPNENNEYLWEIYENGNVSHFIDGSDENSSSWMRFIRCARDKKEQNLSAYQYGQNIYYRSFRDIRAGDELLVWYSDCYVKHLEIPLSLQESEPGNFETPEIWNYVDESSSTSSHVLRVPENPSKKPSTSQLCSFPFSKEIATIYKQDCVSGFEKSVALDSSWSFNPAVSVFKSSLTDQMTALTPCTSKELKSPQTIEFPDTLQREGPKSNFKDFGEGNSKMERTESIEPGSTGGNGGIEETPEGSSGIKRAPEDGIEMKSSLLGCLSSPFQCKQCLKVFTQRIQLQMHVCPKSAYKPFQCGHCAMSFAHSMELRNHVIIHTSDRPFKCGYCGRTFAGATTLNNHVRTHTGEKPFVCNICGKTFSIATQLSRHVKTPGECLRHSTATVRPDLPESKRV